MKLLSRFTYYFMGFSVGLIILLFVLSGKKATCNYGPEARVKNNLLKKSIALKVPEHTAKQYGLNDSLMRQFIQKGDVLFSESNTRKDSCNTYVIALKEENRTLRLDLENCKETVFLISLFEQ